LKSGPAANAGRRMSKTAGALWGVIHLTKGGKPAEMIR